MTDVVEKYKDWIGQVDGATAQQIDIDVGTGTSPEKSRVKYGPAELAYRRDVEAEHDAIRTKHPNSVLDIRD